MGSLITNRATSPANEHRVRHSASRAWVVAAVVVVAVAFILPVGIFTGTAASGHAPEAQLRPAGESSQYPVTFNETGLPPGTQWTLVVAGTHHMNTTGQITVLEGNGTYHWQALPLPGWAPNIAGDQKFNVSGGPRWFDITYLHAWYANISEMNLPAGTNWSVTYNGTTHSTVNPTFSFILANASYTVLVTNPLNGTTGVRYIPATSSYTIKIKGANVNKTDAFSTQVLLSTSANPKNGGSPTPATEWIANNTPVTLGATPAGGYVFLSWTGTGPGSYTGTTLAPTVTPAGYVTEVANFQAQYAVTFTESGLPASTSWAVTLNGVEHTSTTVSIVFNMPNSTYPFQVGTVAGFVASPSSGTVTVAGAPVSKTISFAPFTYALTFAETGLAAGTSWSVTVAGTTQSSTTTTVVFQEPNGTYAYNLTPIAGYTSTAYTGNVTVSASVTTIVVVWTLDRYNVTFSETGLPASTPWSVTLGGVKNTSTGSLIWFPEQNGTFSFTVGSITHFTAVPASGNVTINGQSKTISIAWSGVYAVTVSETGLPSGTNWSVSINGQINSSATSAIGFELPNGNYTVVVLPLPGYTPNAYQIPATVNNAATVVSVTWGVSTFAVTFTESGLAGGTDWSVTVDGSVQSSVTSTIVFNEPNGTHSFTAGTVSGYTVSPTSANVVVSGHAVSEAIAYSSTSGSSSSTTLSPLDLGLIAAIVAILAVLGVVVVLARRRRKAPPPLQPVK
jgi:hypothetical protein